MSAYRMGIVGFAILGVYMVITAITQIPTVASVWSSWPLEGTQLGGVQLGISIGSTLNVLVYLFAGWFLVRNRHGLAAWAVGTGEDDNEAVGSGVDLLAGAYSVLGIYLVVVYGSGLVRSAPFVFVRAGLPGSGAVELIAQGVPVLVGLVLFFRSRWLAGLWSRSGKVGPEASVSSVASRWSHAGRKPEDETDRS